MRHRFAGRGLLVGSCLLAFLGTACTPSDPPPTPPTTVASATPTENAQEREERLAYQAAEASYREFRAEVERVYSRGGAAKPTAVMKATAGGQYLASYQEVPSFSLFSFFSLFLSLFSLFTFFFNIIVNRFCKLKHKVFLLLKIRDTDRKVLEKTLIFYCRFFMHHFGTIGLQF
jgi:hypothetical protein